MNLDEEGCVYSNRGFKTEFPCTKESINKITQPGERLRSIDVKLLYSQKHFNAFLEAPSYQPKRLNQWTRSINQNKILRGNKNRQYLQDLKGKQKIKHFVIVSNYLKMIENFLGPATKKN